MAERSSSALATATLVLSCVSTYHLSPTSPPATPVPLNVLLNAVNSVVTLPGIYSYVQRCGGGRSERACAVGRELHLQGWLSD